MSGPNRATVPSDLGELLQRLNRAEDRLRTLETQQRLLVVGITANSVIIADSSGQQWKLGVTTAGATTWTQV